MIRSNLMETKKSFNAEDTPVENWLAPYYQFCNRLAVLHFLQKKCNSRIPSNLLMIYFYGDRAPSHERPRSAKEWENELTAMYKGIGLDRESELYGKVHTLFLPVNPKAK